MRYNNYTKQLKKPIKHIAKILMPSEFVGMKELQFVYLRGKNNTQKLDEFNYPKNLITEHYLCAIRNVIMTRPFEQTGVGLRQLQYIHTVTD